MQRYRQEYATTGAAALSVTALLNRQTFIERIDQAIVQQTVEIARQTRQLEQVRDHWKQTHARESALDSVVAQHREHERRAEDRQEQAEVDERMQHRRSR